jgi:hypothetical protein
MNKRIGPLFFEGDPPEWRRWIAVLRLDLKYYVKRCNEHHIKIGKINFWPVKGTISVDGREGVERGDWLGFVRIVLKTYPRYSNEQTRGGSTVSPPERPHPIHLFSAAALYCRSDPQDEPIIYCELDSGDRSRQPPVHVPPSIRRRSRNTTSPFLKCEECPRQSRRQDPKFHATSIFEAARTADRLDRHSRRFVDSDDPGAVAATGHALRPPVGVPLVRRAPLVPRANWPTGSQFQRELQHDVAWLPRGHGSEDSASLRACRRACAGPPAPLFGANRHHCSDASRDVTLQGALYQPFVPGGQR